MFDGSTAPAPFECRRAVLLTEVATEPWQLKAYRRLRQEVFVGEQGLFEHTDADDADESALAIVAMTLNHGMPDQVVGTVRIFRRDVDAEGIWRQSLRSQTWFGGRLAVAAAYRRHGLVGEALIRAAVCTAHALGCSRFLATVQLPVVRYFERRHFAVCGHITVCGVPHALMQADLTKYPAKFFGSLEAMGAVGRRPEAA